MPLRPIGNVTLPPRAHKGMDVLTYLRANDRALQELRDRLIPASGGRGGRSTAATTGNCYFGEITTWEVGEDTLTGIRGGIVYCGDKNFNVGNKDLDLETPGVWLIYLEIACESNMDDDDELILPGILTSSETDTTTFWQSDAWTVGPPETSYPDNTNPTVATVGIGTINIPLGKLTIAEGVATFAATGCGNITITQCMGTLAHTR